MNTAPKYRSVQDFGVASATGKQDLQTLHDLRFEYPKNLLSGYLNVNIRNKIDDLREIIYDIPLDYFVINETKLGDSFPNAPLTMSNYK